MLGDGLPPVGGIEVVLLFPVLANAATKARVRLEQIVHFTVLQLCCGMLLLGPGCAQCQTLYLRPRQWTLCFIPASTLTLIKDGLDQDNQALCQCGSA